ncbi:hypothetical protein OESDEN_03553 [Oesophagostomum dentatum]|uniref:Secreted protein n=1 Tax=Oesophagostomum dentatum TaxID=61180 RepID=A0A0B1TK54_OESDE|nr:hypothetical protein OESDEN_03553 [Oesophagostomum dentatum]
MRFTILFVVAILSVTLAKPRPPRRSSESSSSEEAPGQKVLCSEQECHRKHTEAPPTLNPEDPHENGYDHEKFGYDCCSDGCREKRSYN